jgi:hypothetical protein
VGRPRRQGLDQVIDTAQHTSHAGIGVHSQLRL